MRNGHTWLIGPLVAVALAALVLIAPGQEGALAQGDTIYVDADAEGDNNGDSWTDAYTDLQLALAEAEEEDQIWVAEGTYKPTQESSPGDPRSATFQMKNGVAIYGGFDPSVGHTAWEDRDWEAHQTILSGDLNGDDGENFANNDENSYHVFFHPGGTGLDGTAVLDGFTITRGNADGVGHWDGGGMYNDGSSPTLSNCTFEGNWADDLGGGMHNRWSSSALTNCTFEGNSADHRGGGMYNIVNPFVPSPPTLTNCTFEGNSADYGGGMYNYDSPPMLTNCTFEGNSAVYGGGGIYNWGYSSPVLTNCILWGNSPDQIWDDGDSPVTYSDIQGGYPGETNINEDPLFVDPDNGDFHLELGSPCIDAGTNEAPNLPNFDFEGDDRVLDGDGNVTRIVDMGVDEVEVEWSYFGVYLPLVLRGY